MFQNCQQEYIVTSIKKHVFPPPPKNELIGYKIVLHENLKMSNINYAASSHNQNGLIR